MTTTDPWQNFPPTLTTEWLGHHFQFFEEIDSTNRYLQKHAAELPHGSVALTDFQSAGRGRLNRRWETPPGEAILMSILLKPRWPIERTSWLTMIAGLAAVNAIREVSGLSIGLKWPNDLVLLKSDGPGWYKIAGILLESALENGWVIGMGINVNQDSFPPSPTPPASLYTLTGRTFNRQSIIRALLGHLEGWFERCDQGENPLAAWRAELLTIGQMVTVKPMGDQPSWSGQAVDVDESGHLLIKDAQGKIQLVTAGDVSLLPG
ncbi:MAG: biotin--[acetyl-CoA-carboxylase] ligase [Ardenticatenaceae bacterium]|nr:biotin--[acetyl-CoA-carboxylase] ligase [Ardenticatenaceae bacterium]